MRAMSDFAPVAEAFGKILEAVRSHSALFETEDGDYLMAVHPDCVQPLRNALLGPRPTPRRSASPRKHRRIMAKRWVKWGRAG